MTLSVATPAVALNSGTRKNLLYAMHGEALAFASYQAFAIEAGRRGRLDTAVLFGLASYQERDEHFAEEADLAELVGDAEENLEDAITGESYEQTHLYPKYARQAHSSGDHEAGALFDELAADEANHQKVLKRALRALRGEGSYLKPPKIHVVDIVSGPARSHGTTLANLRSAMRGEAFASAKYRMFALSACSHGHWRVGRLFAVLSNIERREHFAGLANLAGLVGTTSDNLRTAIAGENAEATRMYPAFARAARTAGDTEAADRFDEVAADEARHRDEFQDALDRME
jgi:rubrerythrin